jgi:hypothetical protein
MRAFNKSCPQIRQPQLSLRDDVLRGSEHKKIACGGGVVCGGQQRTSKIQTKPKAVSSIAFVLFREVKLW